MTTTAPSAESVALDDERYVFHSWSAQRGRRPLAISGGEGSWFWDYRGNRYLDLSSQLVYTNLGHQHPKLVAAIKEQADVLCTIAPGFANETRNQAARLILSHAPDSARSVFFTNGGAEANENAVRMARLHTGRPKVLVAYRSYHGATAGAITLTGDPRRWPSEPGVPGVVRFFGPYLYRSPFGAMTEDEESARALAHLAEVITLEGVHNVAAVLLESVVGTNGVLVPPPGYLAGVRKLCSQHGVLLIVDEVMAGFGRCGEWFAADRWGVDADLITFAKGVNCGYVPLGGVVVSDAVTETFGERPYPGGLTYSGHPLACAPAVAAIRLMEEDNLIERSRRLGDGVIGPALRELAGRHPSVGEVRGLGCMWALELVSDRSTRNALVPFNAEGTDAQPVQDVLKAALAEGVHLFSHFNRIHVLPPITIAEDDLRFGLDVLDRALDQADRHTA